MSQLNLPHTIDAGTQIVATEHQENYVAIRDIINGNIEGGTDNNLKANGVTARELADALLSKGLPSAAQTEGVMTGLDLRVSAGAGLALNYSSGAAWVTDDSGLFAAGALLPVNVAAGGVVNIAANASGNPRLDQVILTLTGHNTGTVSVLQGTPNAGATLDTRSGAANLPDNAIRLADILMPNGFAGPFVDGTHIRDRRFYATKGTIPALGLSGADISDIVAFQPGSGMISGHGRCDSAGVGTGGIQDGEQLAALVYLPRRIVGANWLRWSYVQDSPTALTGNYTISIFDASGRKVDGVNNVAYAGVAGSKQVRKEALNGMTFEVGHYYVLFGNNSTNAGAIKFPAVLLSNGAQAAPSGSLTAHGQGAYDAGLANAEVAPTSLQNGGNFVDIVAAGISLGATAGVPMISLSTT